MENATRERVRTYLIEARGDLGFAEQHPDISCDVCGPGGEHTFLACCQAAAKAIKGFLLFHNHDPEEKYPLERYDLERLVILAAADDSSFEGCMNVAVALTRFCSG